MSRPRDEELENPGAEPLEEVGAEECSASVPECGLQAGEQDGAAPEDCQFGPMDEIHDQFVPQTEQLGLSPEDGLPVPMNEGGQMPTAPPFDIDHVVCIEDDRVYVEVFEQEYDDWIDSSGPTARDYLCRPSHADDAEQTRGRFRLGACVLVLMRDRHTEGGEEQERREFDPAKVLVRFGGTFVSNASHPYGYTPVRPRRPRCQYYKRQVFSIDGIAEGELGHQKVFRNCTMRRSVGGAFMGVGDEAVYACDYRSPPDPASAERWLDAKDRERLAHQRVQLPLFGIVPGSTLDAAGKADGFFDIPADTPTTPTPDPPEGTT